MFTDYPPPPPPVEDSVSFPQSSISFPPPPINSYDYQVSESFDVFDFSRLSVTLGKAASNANAALSSTLSLCTESNNTVCPFELKPSAEMSRCCLEQPPKLKAPHRDAGIPLRAGRNSDIYWWSVVMVTLLWWSQHGQASFPLWRWSPKPWPEHSACVSVCLVQYK